MNKYIKFFVGFVFFGALAYAAEHRQPVIFDTTLNQVVEPTNFVAWIGTAAGGNATNAQPPATILTNLVNNIGPTTNGVVTYVGNSNFITRRVLPGYGILVTNTGFTNDITIAIDTTVAGGSGTNGQPANTGLTNITRVISPGILVVTATNTYTTRTIQAGTANITVTSGSGVAGSPTINFVPNGSANELQYNAGGSALGSSANLVFDPTGPLFTENGDMTINGTVTAQTLNESVGGNLANSWGYDLRATNALNGKYLNVTNTARIPTLTNDNLTINSNFNVLSVSTTLGVIDWNVARQELTLGVNTNLTFANVKAGNEVRLVVKQNAIGGYSVTVPATVIYFNSTNQTTTLSVNTNANSTTALYFFIANGLTNMSMSGADAPAMSEIANANYATNGQIFMVTNNGVQLVSIPNNYDPNVATTFDWVEEFTENIIGNGTTGDHRWYNNNRVSGGQITTNANERPTIHPGILSLYTVTNEGSASIIMLGATPTQAYSDLQYTLGSMTNWQSKWIFNLELTNFTALYMGFARQNGNTNQPTDGIFLRFDPWQTDSGFAFVCGNSSAYTTNSTGSATTNTWHTWNVANYGTSNSIVQWLDSGTPWTNTVNNPTNYLSPYIMLANRIANTNSWLLMDRISLRITTLAR